MGKEPTVLENGKELDWQIKRQKVTQLTPKDDLTINRSKIKKLVEIFPHPNPKTSLKQTSEIQI